MIKVFGRILCVPENEKVLGYVADNLVETRQFKITDPALFPFSFKLELENGSVKDIFELPHVMEDGVLILEWNITSSCLRFAGPLYVQLRAFSDDDMVWHSEIAEFTVNRSIEAEASLPPILPSEFAEIEKRMTNLLSATETASLSAAAAAEEAKSDLDAVSTYAENALHSAESAAVSARDALKIFSDVETAEQNIAMRESAAENAAVLANTASIEASNYADNASKSAKAAEESLTQMQEILGDMDAALDSILSVQASYIGGDAV